MASLIRYQIEWLLCLFGVEDIIDIIPRQDCSKIIPKSAHHFISIITQFMRRLLPEQEIIIDVEMLNIFSLYCSPSQIAQSIGLFFSIKPSMIDAIVWGDYLKRARLNKASFCVLWLYQSWVKYYLKILNTKYFNSIWYLPLNTKYFWTI